MSVIGALQLFGSILAESDAAGGPIEVSVPGRTYDRLVGEVMRQNLFSPLRFPEGSPPIDVWSMAGIIRVRRGEQ